METRGQIRSFSRLQPINGLGFGIEWSQGMSQTDTLRLIARRPLLPLTAVWLCVATASFAQTTTLDWRRVGTSVVDRGLASPAGGAADRVWYSADGARLYVRTQAGKVFETGDFESWRLSGAQPPTPPPDLAGVPARPEPAARTRGTGNSASPRLYSFGGAVYTSIDQGRSWRNVSHYRGASILGGEFADLAVSPRDVEEIAVVNDAGIWRSLDGGLTWSGLNESLPNLPVRKLYDAGVRLRVGLSDGSEAAWLPGQRAAWNLVGAEAEAGRRDLAARLNAGSALGARISALAAAGDLVFAGSEDGRVWSSADRGANWREQRIAESGVVAALVSPAGEPRVALAAVNGRVWRTFNGGLFWDDVTGNLAAGGAVHGLAADLESGAIYAAADAGVFAAYLDLRGGAAGAVWTRIELPAAAANAAAAWDVKLDAGGHQLFVALDGAGVFAALAPHRLRVPKVVNAADRSQRAAAPGTLLSVMGASIASARAGNFDAPVLGASAQESQIQVPFEVGGAELSLALLSGGASPARRLLQFPLLAASPAIFVDRDGAPMLVDADRGVLIEPGRAIAAGSRIQILATGLGRVAPDWPTGTPAPAENTPRVVAPVRVLVDRVPVEVTRATLAPGFVGFYLIEIVLPEVVNNGPAELYIEAAGEASGRVAIQLVQ